MATIHDMFPELLQEIFLVAISDRIRVPGRRVPIPYSCHPTYSSSSSPYSISHVCMLWRDISLNQPDLWTHLCIRNPKSFKLVHLLKEWIRRSQSHPLHLAFKCCATRYYPQVAKAVFSVLLASLHRCRTLALDIDPDLDNMIDPDHTQIPDPASLDCLSLRLVTPLKPLSAPEIFVSSLLRASTLLSAWVGLPMTLDASMPWVNLRHLSIHSRGRTHEIPQILSHCRRLETLDIYHPWDFEQRVYEITLPHLTRLSLNWAHFAHLFMNSFTLPALSELILDAYVAIGDGSIAALLQRSNASLKLLEVNAVERDPTIVQVLTGSHLTELETLRLTDKPMSFFLGDRAWPVWPKVFALLMKRESGTWRYLPHLRHFSLRTQDIRDLLPFQFETLARTRLGELGQDLTLKLSSLSVSSGLLDFSFTIPDILSSFHGGDVW